MSALQVTRLVELWGVWLGSLTIQISALVLVVLAACWALREASPSIRYVLWLVVLGRMLIAVPIASPWGLLAARPDYSTTASARADASNREVGRNSGRSSADTFPGTRTGRSVPEHPSHFPTILFLVWLAGALGFANLMWRRHRRLRRGLLELPPLATGLRLFVQSEAKRLHLGHVPEVRLLAPCGDRPLSPCIIGLAHPVLAVPAELCKPHRRSDSHPLLVHELMHLKRRDHWINFALAVVQCLYFFNPLVWVAGARIRREREPLCDDAVVDHYDGATDGYLEALYGMAELLTRRRPHHESGIGLFRGRMDLLERARRLAAPSYGKRSAPTMAVLALVAGVYVAGLTAWPEDASSRTWLQAERLATDEVALAERRLLDDPDAHEPRAKLVRHYALSGDEDAPERHAAHALWLIEHDPEMSSDLATYSILHRDLDPASYDRSRALWLQHVDALPENATVLRNAANFLLSSDPETAEQLLLRGRPLAPRQSFWPRSLSKLYRRRAAASSSPAEHGEWSTRAHREAEGALALTGAGDCGPGYLVEVAVLARDAGGAARAEQLAEQALLEAEGEVGTWSYGDVVHRAHLLLGELALDRGRTDLAVERLLSAADVPGSPGLDSFGPGMRLADRLLQLGESQAVLDYFERCARFWRLGEERLDAWSTDVRAGRRPGFGRSLR